MILNSSNKKRNPSVCIDRAGDGRNRSIKGNRTLNSIYEKSEQRSSNFTQEKTINNDEKSITLKENEISLSSKRDKLKSERMGRLNNNSTKRTYTQESEQIKISVRSNKARISDNDF